MTEIDHIYNQPFECKAAGQNLYDAMPDVKKIDINHHNSYAFNFSLWKHLCFFAGSDG
jgi:hypothetical protein